MIEPLHLSGLLQEIERLIPYKAGEVETMKCKQYGRCSNFYDTECSGEDGSTPIACSHFSKIDLVRGVVQPGRGC